MHEDDIAEIFGGGFDMEQELPDIPDGGELMTPGWYTAEIQTELEPTKAGDGMKLVVEHSFITDGFSNRKSWANINIQNPSEKAEARGQRELQSLGAACGVKGKLTSRAQLNGSIVDCHVIVEKGTKGYADKNIVNKWAKAGEGGGKDNPAPGDARSKTAPRQPQPQQGPDKSTTPKRRPWDR